MDQRFYPTPDLENGVFSVELHGNGHYTIRVAAHGTPGLSRLKLSPEEMDAVVAAIVQASLGRARLMGKGV